MRGFLRNEEGVVCLGDSYNKSSRGFSHSADEIPSRYMIIEATFCKKCIYWYVQQFQCNLKQ